MYSCRYLASWIFLDLFRRDWKVLTIKLFFVFHCGQKIRILNLAYEVGRWWWSPVWRTRRRVFWGALGITEQPESWRGIVTPTPEYIIYVNLRLLNNVYHEADISLPKCKLKLKTEQHVIATTIEYGIFSFSEADLSVESVVGGGGRLFTVGWRGFFHNLSTLV